MNCKFKDHPFPPCQFAQHPHDRNIYFCPHCQESYDVRDVGNRSPKWLILIIAAIILFIIGTNSESFSPSQDDQLPTNSETMAAKFTPIA